MYTCNKEFLFVLQSHLYNRGCHILLDKLSVAGELIVVKISTKNIPFGK